MPARTARIGAEDAHRSLRRRLTRSIADGIDARGPLPADTMFHAGARATYDAALCMYHDQALIPIKTLAFDHAVNVTLGPAVRAHLARSRHRLRHRRHRAGRSVEPDRRARTCGPAGHRTIRRLATTAAAHDGCDDLPPLREVIRRYDLSARKSLGQNFLLDLNLTGRIARAGRTARWRHRGRGRARARRSYPRAAGRGRARVIAIERDPRAVAALAETRGALSRAGSMSSRTTRSRSIPQPD